jgi:DNA gyrase/topoisomerase IV subunit A
MSEQKSANSPPERGVASPATLPHRVPFPDRVHEVLTKADPSTVEETLIAVATETEGELEGLRTKVGRLKLSLGQADEDVKIAQENITNAKNGVNTDAALKNIRERRQQLKEILREEQEKNNKIDKEIRKLMLELAALKEQHWKNSWTRLDLPCASPAKSKRAVRVVG